MIPPRRRQELEGFFCCIAPVPHAPNFEWEVDRLGPGDPQRETGSGTTRRGVGGLTWWRGGMKESGRREAESDPEPAVRACASAPSDSQPQRQGVPDRRGRGVCESMARARMHSHARARLFSWHCDNCVSCFHCYSCTEEARRSQGQPAASELWISPRTSSGRPR